MKFSKELDQRLYQYLRLLRFKLSWGKYTSRLSFDGSSGSPAAGRAGLVIFTAADSGYLKRFVRPYLLSASAHVESPCIHVHLYNPEPEDFVLLCGLRRELPNIELSWSCETFSPGEWERRSPSSAQQSWKSLYICTSRFLAADAIQRACGRDLLITDIDVLFNGDVAKRFYGAGDVALFLRPEERNLCKRTLGGMVYVAASPSGRKFISHVAREVSRFLAAGYYWFAFDQFALYCAALTMAGGCGERLTQLTEKDMSFDFDAEGLILVPKGKTREDSEFAALSARYIGSDRGPGVQG